MNVELKNENEQLFFDFTELTNANQSFLFKKNDICTRIICKL